MAPANALHPIPNPAGKPLIGNMLTVDSDAPLQSLMQLTREHGPIFWLNMMGTPLVVVSGASLVEEICDESRFDKAVRGPLRRIRALAGDGLFTGDTQEPNWGKAHNILLPTFAQRAMAGYLPLMYDIAEQLCTKWERLNADDEVDVVHDMTALALDTIGICGFDYRFNSFYRRDYHPVHRRADPHAGDLHGAARPAVREGDPDQAAEPAEGRCRLHEQAGRRHHPRAAARRRRPEPEGSAQLHAGRRRQGDGRKPVGREHPLPDQHFSYRRPRDDVGAAFLHALFPGQQSGRAGQGLRGGRPRARQRSRGAADHQPGQPAHLCPADPERGATALSDRAGDRALSLQGRGDRRAVQDQERHLHHAADADAAPRPIGVGTGPGDLQPRQFFTRGRGRRGRPTPSSRGATASAPASAGSSPCRKRRWCSA